MIRFHQIIASALLIGAALPAAHALDLKLGVSGEPYPPFTTKGADGKWSGFEIDMANAVCKRLAANCQIVEVAWDGIIPALVTKKIDAIFSSMSITPERQKTIAFSVPYYYSNAVFVGPKSLHLTGISPSDLKGKSIGVQTSTINADYLKQHYAKTSSIRIYNTQDEVNSDQAAGRIDLQLVDEVGMYDYLSSPEGASLEKKGAVPKDPIFGPGIGVGLRKQDADLKSKVDAAIQNIYQSGEFKTMQAKYFKIDISAR
jgi:polar amino acid transport system substrate-binding protein